VQAKVPLRPSEDERIDPFKQCAGETPSVCHRDARFGTCSTSGVLGGP